MIAVLIPPSQSIPPDLGQNDLPERNKNLAICAKSPRFAKLANSPKLKFWMSQLELEYHDGLVDVLVDDSASSDVHGDTQSTRNHSLRSFVEFLSSLRCSLFFLVGLF